MFLSRTTLLLTLIGAIGVTAVGCGDKSSDDTHTSNTDDSGSDSGLLTELEAVCTEPVEVGCVDEMILDLSLQDNKTSDGEVTTTVDGDDFLTDVDATAGGYSESSRNAWTYIKFTAEGAVKVEIDDESALESMDWDMALKRYLIRLNSGDSGPSCVGSAAMIGFEYAELDEVPEGISWLVDDFYTDDCTLITDSIGGAQTVMAPWWQYGACVATTGVPFLLQLADGHIIKLAVEKYYLEDEDQATCDETGEVPMGTEGAWFRLRWQMML